MLIDKGLSVLSQAQRVQPLCHLLCRPNKDIVRQAELREVGRPPHRRRRLARRLAVEIKLIKVAVVLLDKAAVRAPRPRHRAGGALLARRRLLALELEAHVLAPHAGALQLKVVRVEVAKLLPSLLHLQPRHVLLQRALERLLLQKVGEGHARPRAPPAAAALEAEVVQVLVRLLVAPVLHGQPRDVAIRAVHRPLLDRHVGVKVEAQYAGPLGVRYIEQRW